MVCVAQMNAVSVYSHLLRSFAKTLLTRGLFQMHRRKVHQVLESATARLTHCVCVAVVDHTTFRRSFARLAVIRIPRSAFTTGP